MDGNSLSITEDKIQALRQILPEVFSENQIDWEKLKATLGENINFSNERYVLNWAGKSDAFKVLQVPFSKTLVPAREESVNFDETQNIFIEGENLEALKVLQKSYFGKVKMIYIDPPYNTGNDSFIYPDKFSETKAAYEKRVGDKDEEGYMTKDGMFKKNSKENGQYHSNWLNMMMPRLYLAKNLLRQDGVIFVSIDDNEVHNLRLLMNEVFGEENFVGNIIWKNVTDNNPTNIAIEHEYIVCFAKDKSNLSPVWKSKISDIKDLLVKVGDELNSRFEDLDELQAHYSTWFRENKNQLWPLENYKFIDRKGVYSGERGVHNPGKEGYRYDIIHPITKKACKEPLMGYRFPEETMKKMVDEGRIIFGEDEDKLVEIKVYAKDYLQKLSSLLQIDGRTGANELKMLFPEMKKVFTNPKTIKMLEELISFACDKNDIVLDFFAGSGSTAHAIMELNLEDGGKRKFILVQLDETSDEKSESFKQGYRLIPDITKERIRRAGKKIKSEIDLEIKALTDKLKKLEGELPTQETKEEIENLKSQISNLQSQDLGFKVLKLDESNFKQWKQISGHDPRALAEQIKLFVDPVAESATAESMVYELLLKSGKDLNSRIAKKSDAYWINGKELVVILDKISEDTLKEIIDAKPAKVIALDRIFKDNDQLKTNTVLQMRDAGVEFKTI